ncbi:retrovirus-related pol polyprotein from transposon TNT 1-94 [Tanacetum coccineum]
MPINKARASIRTNLITTSQPFVFTQHDVNSDSNGLSSTGIDNIAKTKTPQSRSNTKNDGNDKSEVVYAMLTVRFGNDHVATILGYGDLQWGNILIARVYYVEGLGHNMFSVGQFCDSDLEVAFRRNTCFVRNLEEVDLLKGNRITNLYTINLHEMASASPIYLMARATSTKSWLWHQSLSHVNFDTINDLAKNDLIIGLPKFKYHKEHLCPSYEQEKSKKASHYPNLFQIQSKDEAPEEIKTFLKKITVLLQAPVIIVRTDNNTEFKNQVLKEYCFDIEEKNSGSTTTHSDYSLPDYDAFYFDNDHIEEKSSGSTTTHSDFYLPEYDSFIFDLSINPFPPADRSVFHHEEFADELAHIISLPEYDHFYFDLEIDPGEFTRVLEENIFDLSTKGLTINELNDSSPLLSDCDSSLSKEFFNIDLLVSFPPGNEDKVFDPEILIIDGVFSSSRKSLHLLINNFLIDKCHILSEISLMTESSVSFHPKEKEIQGESS